MKYRPYYLAREWVKMGHSVTIAGASFSHSRSRNPEFSGFFSEEFVDGIRFVWLKTPKYKGNGVPRIINMLAFVSLLYFLSGKLVGSFRPDAVIASSTYPLDIFPASRIARKYGAKLVFHVHDLWPMTPVELGKMSPGHPFIRVMQKAEDYYCKHADTVISVLPYANRHLETRGMAPEKFFHVPNGIAIEEWECEPLPLPEPHASLIERLRNENAFIMGYAGGFGLSNALDSFLESMTFINQCSVKYLLVGHGPEEEHLSKLIDRYDLKDRAFLLPRIDIKYIPSFLAACDALYIGAHASPLYQFGVSMNKLFDYMISGRPILNAVEAANNPVEEAGCGLSVAHIPKDIADGLIRLMSIPGEEREAMGVSGKRYALENHTYETLAKRFLSAMFGS